MTIQPANYTPQELLALPMQDNDANAATIGQYLAILTTQVWDYEESFDGKRPFGNSGWQADIHYALIKAEAVKGTIDESGWMTGYDLGEINLLMQKILHFLREADYRTLTLPPAPKDWIVVAFDAEESIVQSHVTEMMDEATAFAEAQERNNSATFWKWTALRVPK